MSKSAPHITDFEDLFLALYEAMDDDMEPGSGLWIYFKFLCDNLQRERLCLLMLYQLGAPELVTYSVSVGEGRFSSTQAFADEHGFGFEVRHAEYSPGNLWQWFFPTIENQTWIALIDEAAQSVN